MSLSRDEKIWRRIETEIKILELEGRVEEMEGRMAALVGKVDKALHLGGDGGSATAARKTCCVHEDERREKIERSGNGEVVEESGSQIETVERQLKPPSAFILTDQEVILPPGQAHSQAGINPHIQDRQASSTRNPPPTNVPPSQTSSSPHAHIAEASTHTTHDPLLQETSKTPFRPPTPEYPASSWIHLASILQTRNRYLERELEDYREMCNSLVQDVRWQMGAQGELEEQLEAERGEKERVLEELVGLKRRWRGVVGLVGGRSWSYECYGSIAGDASDGCGDDMGCEDFITLPRSSSPLYPQGDETSPQQYSTSTGESTDDRSSFRGDLATAESGTGNIAAPFFTFLPKLSMIIFPADTAQIFQFPGASTLSQIRSILEYKYRRGIEDNPCLVRVREIMQVREDMGVRLPEGLRDERLVIAIPEGGEEVEKEVKGWGIEGGEVGIEAWETWLDDDAEGLETMAGCLGVGVDDVDAFMRRSRETDDGSEDEDLDGDLGELNDSMVGTNDAYNDDESERVCECELCTNRDLNPYAETQSSYPPPLVSVRGGAGQEESSSPPGSDSNNESQCFESPHLPFSPFNQRMKRESSQESIRHEDDAPTPTTTTTRSSPKRADDYGVQNDKGRNYGEGNEYPFPIVEDPDLRLRGGGACDEDRKDGEENWVPEWYRVASRTHCSGCKCQTSWEEAFARLPSPVECRFSVGRRIQAPCFDEQHITSGEDHSQARYGRNSRNPRRSAFVHEGDLGESIHHLNHHRVSHARALTGSKTHSPYHLKTEGSGYEHEPRRRGLSIDSGDGSSEYKVTRWLENPRPAPSPPSRRRGSNRSISHDIFQPADTEQRSHRSRSTSRTRKSLRKQLVALLRILRSYIRRILRLAGRSTHTSASLRTKPSSRTSPRELFSRKEYIVDAYQDGLSPSARPTDQSPAAVPKVLNRSMSTESLFSKPTSSLPPTPPPKCSLRPNIRNTSPQLSQETAQINSHVTDEVIVHSHHSWVPPTVAGPSDPTREAKLRSKWRQWQERRESEFDGMMNLQSSEKYMRWKVGEDFCTGVGG